jgi:AcrR family transcriptional regulator
MTKEAGEPRGSINASGSRKAGRPTADETQRLDAKIVEAAFRVFVRESYAGATIDQIAQVSATTRRSVSHRYPDKESILVAVVEVRMREQLVDVVSRESLTSPRPIDALRDVWMSRRGPSTPWSSRVRPSLAFWPSCYSPLTAVTCWNCFRSLRMARRCGLARRISASMLDAAWASFRASAFRCPLDPTATAQNLVFGRVCYCSIALVARADSVTQKAMFPEAFKCHSRRWCTPTRSMNRG